MFPPTTASAQAGKTTDTTKTKDFKFEVVSIRPLPLGPTAHRSGLTPDGFNSQISLWYMIMLAYAPEEFPAWLNSNGATRISNPPQSIWDVYEVKARVGEDDREAWRNQGSRNELLKAALRDVLKERFKLVIRQQPTEVPGLRLVATKNGPKLKPTLADVVLPPGRPLRGGGVAVGVGAGWHYYGATMEDLAAFLALTTQRPVHDSTRLTGRYEFSLQCIDNPSHDVSEMQDNWPITQLGLALVPGKVPGLTLIIDHIEKPTPN